MKDNLKLVTIATTASSSEAQLLKTILEDGGIEAYVQDEMAGQYVSPTGYRIQVEAQNVEAAKEFLAENPQYTINGEPKIWKSPTGNLSNMQLQLERWSG